MDFDAYNGKDIQNFMSMLNQCESEGIIDIRFVRERLDSHLHSRFKAAKIDGIKSKREMASVKAEVCPSCNNNTLLYKPTSVSGYPVMYCKCGFSQITGAR